MAPQSCQYVMEDLSINYFSVPEDYPGKNELPLLWKGITAPKPAAYLMTLDDIILQSRLFINLFLGSFVFPYFFKIGISTEVYVRSQAYQRDEGMTHMSLVIAGPRLDIIETYEKEMIAAFKDRPGCLNIRKGGDGGLSKRFPHMREYYGYVVVRELAGARPVS